MDPYAPPAQVVPSRSPPHGPARAAVWLAVSLMLTYIAPNVVAGVGVFLGFGLANALDVPVDDATYIAKLATQGTRLVVWLVAAIALFVFTRATRGPARIGARVAVVVLVVSPLLSLTALLTGRRYAGIAAFVF